MQIIDHILKHIHPKFEVHRGCRFDSIFVCKTDILKLTKGNLHTLCFISFFLTKTFVFPFPYQSTQYQRIIFAEN